MKGLAGRGTEAAERRVGPPELAGVADRLRDREGLAQRLLGLVPASPLAGRDLALVPPALDEVLPPGRCSTRCDVRRRSGGARDFTSGLAGVSQMSQGTSEGVRPAKAARWRQAWGGN